MALKMVPFVEYVRDISACLVKTYLVAAGILIRTERVWFFASDSLISDPKIKRNLKSNVMFETVDSSSTFNFVQADCSNYESQGAHMLNC